MVEGRGLEQGEVLFKADLMGRPFLPMTTDFIVGVFGDACSGYVSDVMMTLGLGLVVVIAEVAKSLSSKDVMLLVRRWELGL